MKKGSGTQSIIKLCEVCKKPFNSFACAKRKFCSSECAYKGRITHKKQTEYKCAACGKPVIRSPSGVMENVFCSRKCSQLFQTDKPGPGGRERDPEKRITLTCKQCGKIFERFTCSVKSKNTFCSQSCSAKYNFKYNNKFRLKSNNSRSKLEKWLDLRLKSLNVPVYRNDRKILEGFELDFYFPTKNIAFEIDGPWHTLPIYGKKKLNYAQYNDKCKDQLCKNLGIQLIRIQNIQTFTEQIGEEVFKQIATYLN